MSAVEQLTAGYLPGFVTVELDDDGSSGTKLYVSEQHFDERNVEIGGVGKWRFKEISSSAVDEEWMQEPNVSWLS